MDRATMTDRRISSSSSSISSSPAFTPPSHDYAVLPSSAPDLLRHNTIAVTALDKIQMIVDDRRRRNFQALVRRYMNQLLYGCQNADCETPTCYTARKRIPPTSRRLTLLSARIIACSLASQDDPLGALCPGKPVVPTLAASKNPGVVHFADQLDDDEKENRPDKGGGGGGPRKPALVNKPGDVSIVTDKGLKDPRSFPQQLFSTMALKMVEWVGLPPPQPQLGLDADKSDSPPSPQEPPKIKFPTSAMDVMDTGRLTRDSEPVSQTRHQEIMQQPPRKRGPSFSVTPPHPVTKAKLTTPVGSLVMPSPPHLHRRPAPPALHLPSTPSRGDKYTQTLWEPEPVAPPQTLKALDKDICRCLMEMCASIKAPAERREWKQFAKQSIFYVFSTPSALLSSFGGIGTDTRTVGFDPAAVNIALDTLYTRSWGEEHVKRAMWAGLANVFAKPGRGMSDRDAAGVVSLAIHVLSRALVRDEEVFRLVVEARSAARVSQGANVLPDIGLDDELAERLARRVVRALSFRRFRPDDDTLSHIRAYLEKAEELHRAEREARLQAELLNTGGAGSTAVGLPRCLLEWTRTIFMRTWTGEGAVARDSLPGTCLSALDFLISDHAALGLAPELFETKTIGDRINAYVDPVDWFHRPDPPPGGQLHILDHPYVLQVQHAVAFFRSINLSTMKGAYEQVIGTMRMANDLSRLTKVPYTRMTEKLQTALRMYFVLTVRRTNLLTDTLNQLMHREQRELLRPLKVRFVEGEEGVDQGGVQQEFFSLLMKEILNPAYGMFTTDDRTRISWFSESSLEPASKFELVGLAVGLAVYNGITLPVNFPRALYIKLLGGTPTLDDISDAWPELASGLHSLLAWSDGDVADVFVRTYEYSYEVFGEVRSIDMLSAKSHGPDHLPPPVAAVKQPPRPRPPQTDQLYIDPPAVHDDNWLGGLGEILQRLDSEQRRGYEVTYTDLNEESPVLSSPSTPPSSSGDPASLPLPPDSEGGWSPRSSTYSPSPSSPSLRSPPPEAPTPPHEAPLVTNENREEYVDDYLSWLTTRSIHRSYTAFARGFFSILPSSSLRLLSPSTFQSLVQGSSTIDIAALEAAARYEDGYHANHRVIQDFWAVVRGFSEEKKQRLLEFVTSSSRVPVGGVGGVMFYIVRNGEDSERLPTSLTCFGRLLLPEYGSRKKLKRKLGLALENARGFGNA